MKASLRLISNPVFWAAASLLGAAVSSTAAPGASASPTNAALAGAPIPQSVFVIPSSPKEGRNPFFPRSTMGMPQPAPGPTTITNTPAADVSLLVLNGITSPPRRSAMINSRTFEPGEEGEVKLPSGAKMLIKCIEVKDDSVIIEVGGQRRELRMRRGL